MDMLMNSGDINIPTALPFKGNDCLYGFFNDSWTEKTSESCLLLFTLFLSRLA